MSLCSIASYNKKNIPGELSQKELQELDNKITFNIALFLKEFVKCDNVGYNNQTNEYILMFNEEENLVLSNDDLDEVFNSFKEIYCISNNQKVPFSNLKPHNEEDEKFLDIMRMAQNNINRKENGVHTIDSVIMGITSKSGSNYNLFNIWGLTIWQLMEVNSVMHKDDNAYFTKVGIYTGNIDVKKSKIKPKDLDCSVRDD